MEDEMLKINGVLSVKKKIIGGVGMQGEELGSRRGCAGWRESKQGPEKWKYVVR